MWKKYGILLMPLLVAACACHPKTATTATNDLTMNQRRLSAYHWQLIDAQNTHSQPLDGFQAGPKLKLDFSDDQLNIAGGCNNMKIRYTLENNIMHASDSMETKMACAAPLMQQDRATAQFLSTTPVTLRLTGTQQTPVLLMQDSRGNRLTWQGTPTGETRYGSQPESIFLEVKSHTQACQGAHGQQQCLQVREVHYNAQGVKTGHGAWHHFDDQISGYQHNPALRQVLRVKRYTLAQPAADQSRYAWELDMVVESATAH